MKFKLYFAGSRILMCDQELQRLQCNRLLSNMNDRSAIMKWVEFLQQNPDYTGSFFIDSGAYSAFSQNKKVDVDDYINFINTIGDYVTVFAQVDTIQHPNASDKEKEACQEATWQNYLYMIDRLKPEYVDKLIPLYHAGENIERFYNLLEWKHKDGHHIKYIGLGAPQNVYRSNRSMYYDEWFKIIKKSSNPDVCTHAFGCTDLEILKLYPFTSADSASWIRSAATANILIDDKWVNLSSKSSDFSKRFESKSQSFKDYVNDYVQARGFTVEELQTDPHAAYIYNIRYLREWELNYTCSYQVNKPKPVALF